MSAVPDEGAVLGFLRSSSAPVGWQQLIRKFVEGGDPNDFKRLVKRLVSEGKMRKIKGRPELLINVYSSRKVFKDNLLDCDIFQDDPHKAAAGIAITCKLIGER